MALRKKKSRPITVENVDYRWQFFENSGWYDVTIQIADGAGAKLVVQFPYLHLNTPHTRLIPLPPVTPAIVHSLILKALDSGWHPQKPGKTFKMEQSKRGLIPLAPPL